jgi:hypothetical protein
MRKRKKRKMMGAKGGGEGIQGVREGGVVMWVQGMTKIMREVAGEMVEGRGC